MNKSHSHTYYRVTVHSYSSPHRTQTPYWRECSSIPAGNTLDQAKKALLKEVQLITERGGTINNNVKFKIVKTVTVETTENEYVGSDVTALALVSGI